LQNPDRIFPDRIDFARWVSGGEDIILLPVLETEENKEKVKHKEYKQEL